MKQAAGPEYLRTVSIYSFDEDYQCLLMDLLPDDNEYARVYRAAVAEHFDEHDQLVDASWNDYDYQHAEDLLVSLDNGAVFPPLIASAPGELLLDGYHRLWAYRKRGLHTAEFIYTDEAYAVSNNRSQRCQSR